MVSRFSVACTLALGAALFPQGMLAAQDVVSQPVVQALPAPEVQRLNRALVALAKAPRDRAALIEAGQAALGVDDLEAAIGFFGRAADVDPGHPDVALGLGSVYLRAGRAGEALLQFDRALAAGADERAVLTDRALSLDLVGEGTAAQAAYTRALELDPANDEARRRLALSYAIAGNTARFEDTLRPLLDRRDLAAQRARAFGLAIMGENVRATAIVEQVMPRDIATRLVPYLGYMPRLTKQQQAAAANLGIFPRSADIGRDDPRLARFAAEERADSRLAPAGAPLGTRPQQVTAAVPTPPPSTTAYTTPVPASAIGSQPAPAANPARVATVTPVAVTTAPPPVPAPAPRPAERVADVFADLGAPSADARVSGDAVDLSRIEVKREAPPPPPAPVAKPAEKPKPKPKEPPKPVHPSRVWVQVATGKKIDALAFDWKRIAKEGGKSLAPYKPHTARWGATNRLVIGPVASRDKAEAMVRELKKKGMDVFLWLSDEGEAVQPLK
ncbi:tetratricopeptide repeat protein [Erythrobacter sp. CCH5-A1]|jgi:Flp pilus assembly protein TadD|uniref:tetratricopeptide repeat protein n=1 Tax=Erythrobacter sp. CCH5-A1 TaxID=1768792 RepID=UPI000831EBB7|nr:tetratricopeptide repeat protein [Erythrobacter sp. CCH5-A1]